VGTSIKSNEETIVVYASISGCILYQSKPNNHVNSILSATYDRSSPTESAEVLKCANSLHKSHIRMINIYVPCFIYTRSGILTSTLLESSSIHNLESSSIHNSIRHSLNKLQKRYELPCRDEFI